MDASLHCGMACSLVEMKKDYKGALASFKAALACDPRFVKAFRGRAKLYLLMAENGGNKSQQHSQVLMQKLGFFMRAREDYLECARILRKSTDQDHASLKEVLERLLDVFEVLEEVSPWAVLSEVDGISSHNQVQKTYKRFQRVIHSDRWPTSKYPTLEEVVKVIGQLVNRAKDRCFSNN